MGKLVLFGLLFVYLCGLAPAVSADEIVKVTQVDPTNFPEVALYVSVTDEYGQPTASLTRDDFRLVEDGKPVQIKEFAGTGDRRAADIVFVFDTTTSMVEEVEEMKRISLSFVEKLEDRQVDYRLGLVDFGDVINRVENPNNQLTQDAPLFRQWIAGIRLSGGGHDIPEFSLGALQRATSMAYRDDALKVCILITDAPPHHHGDAPDAGVRFTDPDLTLDRTLAELAEANLTVYVVAVKHPDYEQIVQTTDGGYFNIHGAADFGSIIDRIGGLIATQYRMTYLSARPSYDGTRRAIEVEVAGKKAEGAYLEKHLINVRSSPVIAAVFLLPLFLALLLPSLTRRRATSRPAAGVGISGSEGAAMPTSGAAAAQVSVDSRVVADLPSPAGVVPPSTPGAAAGGQAICPSCSSVLRLGAKFCGRCGRTFVVQPPVPAAPSLAYCTSCGGPLRPGAKFCGVCGHKTG